MRVLRSACLFAVAIGLGYTHLTAAALPGQNPATVRNEDRDGAAKPAAAANVSPDTAVITVKWPCDKPSKPQTANQGTCQTVVTRAQFEQLANALQPNMTPPVKKQLAGAYPRLMVMAHEAQKRGLDNDAHFQQMMQFARLQILSQELTRTLQEQAAQVPDKDITDYYQKNAAAFEQATLLRVYVPRNRSVQAAKDIKPEDVQAQQKSSEEAMSKEADALHKRAVAGEDFEKLQKDAFDFAGLKANPPSTNMTKIRRTNLPPAHVSVFDLKPGEISPMMNDPSGFYFYRVVSIEPIPMEQVKSEIHNTLQSQRMKDSMDSIQTSATTELNDAYFGTQSSEPGPGADKSKPAPASKEPAKNTAAQPK